MVVSSIGLHWSSCMASSGSKCITSTSVYSRLSANSEHEYVRSLLFSPLCSPITFMNFPQADSILSQAIGIITPAAQLVIRHDGAVVHDVAMGFLDPETKTPPANAETLFDLASLTKLFTTAAFMTPVEQGKVSFDNPVRNVLPEFSGVRPIQPYDDPLDWGKTVSVPPLPSAKGQALRASTVDADKITFRKLLVHNSGLPAWRAFKDQPDAQAALQMALDTFFSYPTGERIVYSDVGLILLGLAVSRLTASPLDETIYQRVIQPLGLSAHFQPADPPR